MPRVNEYTFVAQNRPSEETLERWAHFLVETLAGYQDKQVSGRVRRLPPEEAGRRRPVDCSALEKREEAS